MGYTYNRRTGAKSETGLEIGYGAEACGLSEQADFPETTPCVKCEKDARFAFAIRENPPGEPGKYRFVVDVHHNEPDGDGFWVHDCASFATYLCTDIDCATATTLWNQA